MKLKSILQSILLITLLPVFPSCTAMMGDPESGAPGLVYGLSGGLIRTKANRQAAETVRRNMREEADTNKDGTLDASENMAYTERAADFDALETRSQATALLGLVGGVAGAVVGNNTRLGTLGGALIGTGAGALAGNAYGRKVAATKRSYALAEAELDSNIQMTAQLNKQAETFNKQLGSRIATLRQQNNSLSQRTTAARGRNDQIRAAQTEAQRIIQDSDAQIQRLNQEIETQNAILNANRLSATPQQTGALQSCLAALQKNKAGAEALKSQAQLLQTSYGTAR